MRIFNAISNNYFFKLFIFLKYTVNFFIFNGRNIGNYPLMRTITKLCKFFFRMKLIHYSFILCQLYYLRYFMIFFHVFHQNYFTDTAITCLKQFINIIPSKNKIFHIFSCTIVNNFKYYTLNGIVINKNSFVKLLVKNTNIKYYRYNTGIFIKRVNYE